MSKYGNVCTTVNGHRLSSKKEAARYQELLLLERAGVIANLELQPRYPLVVENVRVCTYVADFRYQEDGLTVVEDVKGTRTPVYRLKVKLLYALTGVRVLET